MRRLDAAGPCRAIKAMQAMSGLVGAPVFKAVFFGGLANGHLTMAINFPMNNTLANVAPTAGSAAAQTIWSAYSLGGPFLDLWYERRIHA